MLVTVCSVALLPSAALAAGTALLNVRHGIWPDRSRIVLDLSAATEYSMRLVENPPQILIEIPGTSIASGLSPRKIEDALVRGVRVTRLRGPATLVSIDLRRPCEHRAFALPAEGSAGPRIVVDVYGGAAPPSQDREAGPGGDREGAEPAIPEAIPEPSGADAGQAIGPESASASETALAPQPGADSEDTLAIPAEGAIEEFTPPEALRVRPASPPPAAAAPSPSSASAGSDAPTKPRKRLVAIDAGHGGADSGARRGSTEEKHICLDFAKRLAAAINQVDGFEAYLTRDADFFLPLRRRYQIAEGKGADVFVSIHANAAHSRAANGTEVFFLSLGGASDEEARELAQRENASDEIGGVSPAAEEELASILRDLRRSDALRRSSFLAESVLDELQKIPGVESRGVKQAGFTVLKSAAMPSILVETGFLSNVTERNRLLDPKYQELFVRRLRDGVLGFFQRYSIAQP